MLHSTCSRTAPAADAARSLAPRRRRGVASWALLAVLSAVPLGASLGASPAQDDDPAALVAEADRLRRRGDVAGALRFVREFLDADEDAAARLVVARCRWDRAQHGEALASAEAALALAREGDPALHAACARELATMLLELGRPLEALQTLDGARAALRPALEPRDAWIEARALAALGQRAEAERLLRLAQGARSGLGVDALLARARAERALGDLERAQRTLVEADRLARVGGDGAEPDVLVELGDLYYEADKEVEEAQGRSPRRLYDEALERNREHEGALLGLLRLHRTNWRRTSRSTGDILRELLALRPDSLQALLAAASLDLEDGRLPATRERLARLAELAPARRDVRTLQAALAWVEHRRPEAEAILARLAAEDPGDGFPEREVGRHLLELYRFAEGLPFLRRAVERDPTDHEAWTQLGRALANTGDEVAAREALDQARRRAGLRQDAWRNNMARVLTRMQREYTEADHGELEFVWKPDAAAVLERYLVPFYREAREELSQRYGYTPDPVRIEIFREHADFSVRSTGFTGFPALGVCFGPVVTAVSPLAEMRGQFSWARTSFHEFTHVIHLGLSNNRCPRWITEGLATWEEEAREPSWSRNMRRELLDAHATGQLIPVRELNRAFRGPRILFGYYQGGLLCELLIARHGFQPMVRLLLAFDAGLDLDQALAEVFGTTPEELDRDFAAFVGAKVADLRLEPRWDPALLPRLRLSLPRELPAEDEGRARWRDTWLSIAWGQWQQGRRVDAEEALRQARRAGGDPARALFLEGEIALAGRRGQEARELFERALAAGGEDFRARMVLATMAREGGDLERAEEHLLAAERAFPGFEPADLAAERQLASLYAQQGRVDEALAARERYLRYDSGDAATRIELARWHRSAGRLERAETLFRQANEVDPFRRSLHRDWGDTLFGLGRFEEALREYEVAILVPAEYDADRSGPLTPGQEAELVGLAARCLLELGRESAALERARKALELDAECSVAREIVERVQ